MKLQVGKYYKTKSGRIAHITDEDAAGGFSGKFVGYYGKSGWTPEGLGWQEEEDLVTEVDTRTVYVHWYSDGEIVVADAPSTFEDATCLSIQKVELVSGVKHK
jgi:hypothetical protein